MDCLIERQHSTPALRINGTPARSARPPTLLPGVRTRSQEGALGGASIGISRGSCAGCGTPRPRSPDSRWYSCRPASHRPALWRQCLCCRERDFLAVLQKRHAEAESLSQACLRHQWPRMWLCDVVHAFCGGLLGSAADVLRGPDRVVLCVGKAEDAEPTAASAGERLFDGGARRRFRRPFYSAASSPPRPQGRCNQT
jgi:hypothetical protein